VCSAPSNGTPICAAASCDFQCNAPMVRCGALCVDTKTDPNNCGNCQVVCPGVPDGTATCVASGCNSECNAGFSRCSGACVDTSTDVGNCGACGTICHGKRTCQMGVCK
jgi:hypothetical protein